jgi:hypothetical protein
MEDIRYPNSSLTITLSEEEEEEEDLDNHYRYTTRQNHQAKTGHLLISLCDQRKTIIYQSNKISAADTMIVSFHSKIGN